MPSNRCRAPLPEGGFKVVFQYLACCVLRQFVHQHNLFGFLVSGETLGAPGRDLFAGQCGARFGHDRSTDSFAVRPVRNAENGHLPHMGMTGQHQFDFSGVNIFSTGNDHVLFPVDDEEVSIPQISGQIARMNPTVAEDFPGFFVLAEIADHSQRFL